MYFAFSACPPLADQAFSVQRFFFVLQCLKAIVYYPESWGAK
jgi:hypothetical protein